MWAHRWQDLTKAFRTRPALAAILVTAITLGLVGTVVAATTSLGCGPANRLGLTLSRCNPYPLRLGDTRSGNLNQPTPSPYRFPSTAPSANAPNPNPASNPSPNPTGTNPPTSYPASTQPASGSYPVYPPASSGPSPLALNCRLPIYAGPPGSGGFIVFPDGNFIADPRSSVAVPSPSPGAASPKPTPQMGGPGYAPNFYGMSWDASHSRWLPVPVTWVAPDANHYAYPGADAIYLADASAGTQIELGPGHVWSLLAVASDHVVATIQNAPGLWVLPFTGTPRQVTTFGYWQAATATAAYGTSTSAVPQGAANTILRLDLSKGTTSDWFTRQGSQSSVAGFDAKGNPIIYVQPGNGGFQEVWLTTSPNSGTVIFPVVQGSNWPPLQVTAQGAPIADSHGIWFPAYFQNAYGYNTSAAGIALFTGNTIYGMTSISGALAGGCS